MSINTVILTGRLGRDPELRFFESGSNIACFSLAVDRNSKDKDQQPDWFDVEVWGQSAQLIADYARKGHMVGIEGRLEQQSWTDRASGQKRSKVVVKALRVDLMEPKREGHANGAAPSYQARNGSPQRPARGASPQQQWQSAAPETEDVPF